MEKKYLNGRYISRYMCIYFYDLSFYITDITAEEEKHIEVKNNKYLSVKGDGCLCEFSR